MTGNQRGSSVGRRRFLLVSSTFVAGVAGCLGNSEGEDETDADEETGDADTDDADESEGDQQDDESESRESSGNEVSPVDIQAEDTDSPDSTGTLQVSYSTETLTELGTDPPQVPRDGFQFVLVEMNITNVGDEVYEISPSRYILRIDEVREDEILGDDGVYTPTVTDEFRILQGQDISPEESASGELVFVIPKETKEATLSVNDRIDVPRPVTITFTQAD